MQFTAIVVIFAALVMASLTWASVRGGAMTVIFVTLSSVMVFGIIYWSFAQAS